MDWLLAHATELFSIITSVVGTFALVATLTPNESDNKVADLLFKVIHAFGANFGRATNRG